MQVTLGLAHGLWTQDGTKFGSRLVSRWGLEEAIVRDPRNAAPGWGKLISSSSGANPTDTLAPEIAPRVIPYSFPAQCSRWAGIGEIEGFPRETAAWHGDSAIPRSASEGQGERPSTWGREAQGAHPRPSGGGGRGPDGTRMETRMGTRMGTRMETRMGTRMGTRMETRMGTLRRPYRRPTEPERAGRSRTEPERAGRSWTEPDGAGASRTEPDGAGRSRTEPEQNPRTSN